VVDYVLGGVEVAFVVDERDVTGIFRTETKNEATAFSASSD